MRAAKRLQIVSLHRWLGLTLMLWFVMLGLTGSALVYQHELDAWLNPDLLTDRARADPTANRRDGMAKQAPMVPAEQMIERVIERVLKAFPGAAVERVRLPTATQPVYRLLLRQQADRRTGSPRAEVFVAADNGALLGLRGLEQYGLGKRDLIRSLYDLHHRVLMGNTGKTAVGLVGALLLAMIVLGLLSAMPRKHSVYAWKSVIGIKRRAHRARLIFDLHRSIGVLAFALLLISTLTGFTLAFPDYARDLIGLISPVRTLPVVPFMQREELPPLPLATVLAAVARRYPDATISEVHLPQKRSASLLVYLRRASDWHRLGDTLLFIDPATDGLRIEHSDRTRSAGERLLHSLFPIHSGIAWGAIGRATMFVAGLLPLALAITGTLIWWRKRAAVAIAGQRRLTSAVQASTDRVPRSTHT